MADYDSSLPVRSEADVDQRVQVKLVDYTTPSQGQAVDATGSASVNEAKIAGTAVAVNNGVSGAGVQRVTIASDSTGQVTLAAGANIIGSLTANQTVDVNKIAGTATDVNNGASSAGTIRVTVANDSTGVVGLNTGANVIGSLIANQSVNEAQIAGTATAVNIGNASAGTQRVVIASDQPTLNVSLGAPSGTLVNDYKNATAIAANATDNHDYTVTALKTLTLNKVYAAASGKAKMEIFLNAVSKYVQFNSTANPNMEIDLKNLGVTVGAGLVVRVAMTNLDKGSENLYSTIIGTEV